MFKTYRRGKAHRKSFVFLSRCILHGFHPCLSISFARRNSSSCWGHHKQLVCGAAPLWNSRAVSAKPWKQIANYKQRSGRKAVIPFFTLGPQAASAGLSEQKTAPCQQMNVLGENSGQGKEGLWPTSLVLTITKISLTLPRAWATLVAFPHHCHDCKSDLKWINCPLYLQITNWIIVLGWPSIFKCSFFCYKKYFSLQLSAITPTISFNCFISRRYIP